MRYRQIKSDAEGHIWYLDDSDQDAVLDKTLAADQTGLVLINISCVETFQFA